MSSDTEQIQSKKSKQKNQLLIFLQGNVVKAATTRGIPVE